LLLEEVDYYGRDSGIHWIPAVFLWKFGFETKRIINRYLRADFLGLYPLWHTNKRKKYTFERLDNVIQIG